jgi:outer membrane receptor protein involved in Fe transport
VLVDLLAAYSRKVWDSTVTAQLNVYNLLDHHYYSNLTTNGVGLTGLTGAYADFGHPRMFIGSIRIQY